MKRLIAAIADLRAKLTLIEALLEEGRDERALEVLEEAFEEWTAALKELRSK